ncbi:proton glutamate symporter [Mesoplasma florum W37]|uniref:L-cystine uptake protein TcyP n=1 Tax=Mesoplasma florum TaxID=2151 RepID=A0AAD0HTK0_MESFO|nr:dicarboxylate/amino acid:cation symporter [Mesoplasma florum]AGY41765.1 proton glutamate symporter [Mesoplasma florum W37]AVN66104.1 Proton glutamate symport protein / Sodium glutamate symport protein [Mesoplasma florum]
MLLSSFKETFLQNFLSISTWQSLLAIVLFFGLMGGFWYGLRQIKIKFVYRIFIGISIGLIFGIAIQAIIGFPGGSWFSHDGQSAWALVDGNWIDISKYYIKSGNDYVIISTIVNKPEAAQLIQGQIFMPDASAVEGYKVAFVGSVVAEKSIKSGIDWIIEFNTWASMLRQIFINGILLITIPVVFIAIFRVVAKPGSKGLGRISGKAVAILLINVAIAFTITFWIGYVLKIGKGLNFDQQIPGGSGRTDSKALPEIIWGYIPSNFVATLSATAIIPVIVLAALVGYATTFVRKKHPESMDNLMNFMDRAWDIVMSILMTFMKIMPLAVMAMLTTSITTRAIGALASIGLILGVGYLGLIIMLGAMTLILFLSGINVKAWWKNAWRPFVQAFSTQSSNATLPVTMDTLSNGMKIKDKVTSIVAPLSTSLGLVACAGVQAGLITSVLYTGSETVASMNIFAFFILGLFTTIVASIGIAGVPGTATVVTSAVLNGIGFGAFFAPVYAIFGAIDGLFDMGRTATNVTGGIFAATLVAKDELLFEEGTELISEKKLTALIENKEKKRKLKKSVKR